MADVALCTAAQVKTHGDIGTNERDALIALLIPEALRAFNADASREFMRLAAPATRSLEVTGNVVSLGAWDLRTATTVTLHPESQSEAQVLTAGVHYELALDPDTGTAYAVRLARGLNLWSAHAARFGHAGLTIVGEWGIYADVDAVPADLNKAAIDFVLEALGAPLPDGITPGDGTSGFSAAFPIPRAAWLTLQRYSRNTIGAW